MLSGKRERPLFTPGVPLGREETAGLMTEGKECRERWLEEKSRVRGDGGQNRGHVGTFSGKS